MYIWGVHLAFLDVHQQHNTTTYVSNHHDINSTITPPPGAILYWGNNNPMTEILNHAWDKCMYRALLGDGEWGCAASITSCIRNDDATLSSALPPSVLSRQVRCIDDPTTHQISNLQCWSSQMVGTNPWLSCLGTWNNCTKTASAWKTYTMQHPIRQQTVPGQIGTGWSVASLVDNKNNTTTHVGRLHRRASHYFLWCLSLFCGFIPSSDNCRYLRPWFARGKHWVDSSSSMILRENLLRFSKWNKDKISILHFQITRGPPFR